jgi:site-specific DNA-methyltransferase (adenine-specific)
MIQLIHGECLAEMAKMPDQSVDLILCDLPYGSTQNRWDHIIDPVEMWKQYKRVCKGAIVLTASQPFASVLTCSNLPDFKYNWIWVKSKITGVLNAKKMPVRKHEQVLVFGSRPTIYNAQGLVSKGTITKQGGCSDNYGVRATSAYVQEFANWPRDVIEIASEGKSVHPTQKPVALMEYLIKTYTNEGMTVLDNCMGSGTTGVACVNTGRNFIGIEQDAAYFEIARNRIEPPVHFLDTDFGFGQTEEEAA